LPGSQGWPPFTSSACANVGIVEATPNAVMEVRNSLRFMFSLLSHCKPGQITDVFVPGIEPYK